MAKKTYVGVDNVAQEVSKMYVGVGDVAREVTRMYIGVNGVAERVYNSSDRLKIVTWHGGTDEEIAEMVKAADRGDINLADYWSVGDIRTMLLTIPTPYGTLARSCDFRLLDTSFKTLVNPTKSGRTKCSFIAGMEDLQNYGGFTMHSSNTSINWSNCSGRTTMGNMINHFPQSWQDGVIKLCVNQSSTQSNTNETTNDKIFAPSEWEMFGKRHFARTTRNDGWINWYQTTSHRYKSPNDNWEGYINGACYWLRDKSTDTNRFCLRSSNQPSKEMWDGVPNQGFRVSIHFVI